MKSAIGTMHRFGAQCARLRTLMTAFCRSRRGNVAVITGLAAIPLCAIDYSYASMIKTKLQAAADAATLATVSNNSPSQDYQYQSGGGWGSENWSPSTNVPYQNSATTIPQNPAPPNNRNDQTGGPNDTDWCGTMKSRGITVAILYIPYQPIADASTIFNDEDGYANTNVGYPNTTDYIPLALKSCGSPNFFYTATSPAAIQSDLVTMFEQAVSTAHISQ